MFRMKISRKLLIFTRNMKMLFYSCVPPSRLAAGRAGGMRNNIFMFRVKIRSLRQGFRFAEFLPLFPNRPSCLTKTLGPQGHFDPGLIGLAAFLRPFIL